jgi:hypothetical protein
MKCVTCPVTAGLCLGESVPRLCTLAVVHDDYRRQLVRLASEVEPGRNRPTLDLHDVLAEITRCPYRGLVLPASLQPECGCAELTECRAGRGDPPGQVTTSDCVACVLAREV